MSKRRSYQFFISEVPAVDRTPFVLPGGQIAHVRVTPFEGDDPAALDACEPRDDESVMNTHSF